MNDDPVIDDCFRTLRRGLPERGIWFAGEHTAPFFALGTSTGAYWSGESAATRLISCQDRHDVANYGQPQIVLFPCLFISLLHQHALDIPYSHQLSGLPSCDPLPDRYRFFLLCSLRMRQWTDNPVYLTSSYHHAFGVDVQISPAK